MKLKTSKVILLNLVLVSLIAFEASFCEAAMRNPFRPAIPLEVIEKPEIIPDPTPAPRPTPTTTQTTTPPPRPSQPDRTARPTPTPAPKPEEPVVFPNIKISGVIWNTDKPQAIINDTVVTEGESLQGMTIESISQKEIKLSYKGVVRILQL